MFDRSVIISRSGFVILYLIFPALCTFEQIITKDQPTYLITAPRQVYPTMIYNVAAFVFDDRLDAITVRAAVVVDNRELVFAVDKALPLAPLTIPLQIPIVASRGNYSLNVRGSDERNRLIFTESSILAFSPKFLSVSIQTSRPIYCSGQTVYFRLLILQSDLLPYDGAVDIFVLDSEETIIKRWVSLYTNNGVASLSFTLPTLVKSGYWKIRTKIHDQIDEQRIKVELYYQPLFEVLVELPPFVKDSEEEIKGTVYGMYPSQELIHANATIEWYGLTLENDTAPALLFSEYTFFKGKKQDVALPMNLITEVFGDLKNVLIELQVKMTELLKLKTNSGFCQTRLTASQIKLNILSSTLPYFTPGMLYRGHVILFYENHEQVPADMLESSNLIIQASADGSTIYEHHFQPGSDSFDSYENYTLLEMIKTKYLEEGTMDFEFIIPLNANHLEIIAKYTDESKEQVEAKIKAKKQQSASDPLIYVWTTTENAVVGDFAIFHVKSNFRMSNFKSLIVSKGSILRVAEHEANDIHPTVTTIAIPLSPDMAPVFQFVVFTKTQTGYIVADGLIMPVDGFDRYEMSLEVNLGKDVRGERVEIRISGDEGAYIAFQAQRSMAYHMHAGNEITKSRVSDSFLTFDNSSRLMNKMSWRTEEGLKSVYFTSKLTSNNAKNVFDLSGIVVITDAFFNRGSRLDECGSACNFLECALPCSLSGCYSVGQRCDQTDDCSDGSDETNCFYSNFNDYEYQVSRMSRNIFLYDKVDGDWSRREIKKNDHEGVEFESLTSPKTVDNWYFVGFSMSNRFGFSIVAPTQFSSKKPLMASVNGPKLCRRGEQVGLQVYLHNTEDFEMFVTITVLESADYKFVHVEQNGIVSSYGARLTAGQHQILIYLLPQTQEHVDVPIAPSVEQGEVEIEMTASTQAGFRRLSHKISVLPEGGIVKRHTSTLLDLKSRALVLQYLNIEVEESPVVPYEQWRRYIYGSPKASLTFSSLIIGPGSSEIPRTLRSVLEREGKGAETSLFELSVNVWTLHYLRLTNQLEHDVLKETLAKCSTLFGEVMYFYRDDGSFSNWNTSTPSVWLTSWALRTFKHSSYVDWEYLFYIEPRLFNKTLSWLLQFQRNDGSFAEFSGGEITVNPHLDMSMNEQNESSIVLTAHVLITLIEVISMVDSDVRSSAFIAQLRARSYLEKTLTSLSDSYITAITSYALFVAESPERDLAYQILCSKEFRNNDGLEYWSRDEIPGNPIKLENQRPFIGPKRYHEHDSLAVEATSWALLVFLLRDGITDKVERIVQWLNSVRMTSSGFVSTFDTVIALQALTEYAFRSRILELTNVNILVTVPTSNEKKHRFHLGNSSSNKYNSIPINSVWGHVNIEARGSGLVLAQMDVSYNVDYDPLKDTPSQKIFQLNVTEYYSSERNKTLITIQSCFRYTRDFPKVSGTAVLEIEIPTGYFLVESEAVKIAESGIHPTLRNALSVEGKTVWFFDHITTEWTCFNHTVSRWFPVANISLFRQAILYESLAREHFVHALFNSTPLFLLSICEVCGSYQCPYCPFYNNAVQMHVSYLILLVVIFNLLKQVLK